MRVRLLMLSIGVPALVVAAVALNEGQSPLSDASVSDAQMAGSGGGMASTSADGTQAIPSQHFLTLATDYASAMVKSGRDRYGAPTPLFASQLDRQTLSLPAARLPSLDAEAIRDRDRSWNGSNPMHDQQLYELLYALSTDTKDPAYRDAAAESLKYFFSRAQSPTTGLLAWGEHLSWDIAADRTVQQTSGNDQTHEYFEAWTLWNTAFLHAPVNARKFAQSLWDNQIHDKERGLFSRHAQYDTRTTSAGQEFPRHGGYYVRTWADAYRLSSDSAFKSLMIEAITKLSASYEARRLANGAMPFGTHAREQLDRLWVTESNLSQITDFQVSASYLPADLASSLRGFAGRTDRALLSLPHDVRPGGKGFVQLADARTLFPGDPRPTNPNEFSSSATHILPTGVSATDDGWQANSSGNAKWDMVNDLPRLPDEGATFIKRAGGNGAQNFTFPAPADAAGRTPYKVSLIVRAKRPTTTVSLRGRLKINGVNYEAPEAGVKSAYDHIVYDWPVNPGTGQPWKSEDIDGSGAHRIQEFGIRNSQTSSTEEAHVTQVYLTVRYADSLYTPLWGEGYGTTTSAEMGNLMRLRFGQTNDAGYRALFIAAANLYLTTEPDGASGSAIQPASLASAIDLMLNAWLLTKNPAYLDRAKHFGMLASSLFLDEASPLPKVTSRHDWYESITGGDDLMLSFYRLGKSLAAAGQ